jgi:hypothetical protein
MSLDESQQEVLKNLIRKRGAIKAALTRVRTFINKFNPREEAITLLKFRQEELPQINKKFDDIQCEIELLDCSNDDEAEREREAFESEYFSIRSAMQEIIDLEKNSHNSSLHNSSVNTIVTSHRAALAPISLPQFNGNILEWEPFFDCFKVLVHNEDYYSPAQKFSYLRSTLSGPALDMIKSIPMSEANYEVAIKRLQSRYENKSLVIQTHIRSILDFPSVKIATSGALQELHSHVTTHVAALEALGQPINYWDAWLITVVLRKLDTSTIHSWQLKHTTTELPTYAELETFLASRCVAFESSETWSNATDVRKTGSSNHSKKSLLVAKDSPEEKCACCNQVHKLFACRKFKDMSQVERFKIVRSARLCFNCLSSFHIAPSCQSKSVCQRCKGRHNTLIHFDKGNQLDESNQVNNDQPPIQQIPTNSSDNQQSQVQSCLAARSNDTHVFLATAVVLIADRYGVKKQCRAVLDSGSQINFVSKRLASILGLSRKSADLPISGIGANRVHSTATVTLSIESRLRRFSTSLICHVLPTIIDSLPQFPIQSKILKIPNDYLDELADPAYLSSGHVDLLIGGGIFFDLLEAERVSLGQGSLCLQNTKLGWVLAGEVGAVCLLNVNSIGQPIEDEWISTNMGREPAYGCHSKGNKKCLEEQEAAKHFIETATRDEHGRFVLKLPLKPEVSDLGDTFNMATCRFLSVERRLHKDEALKEAYIAFMEEYRKAGHMVEVIEDMKPNRLFYLPHHPVFKESSLTTKLRVVFDASAKSTTGISLNEVLLKGPTVQEELFDILVRFRKHQYVLTADVEKMFRQVAVATQDQDLQRILWRTRPSETLRSYKLTTVTYGTTSASYMATQCLVVLAEEHNQSYPEASRAIKRDFYMDDLMTGAESIEECVILQEQISLILDSAQLPLRKWCSNSEEILKSVEFRGKEPLYVIHTETEDVVKSLGLCWKPTNDEFGFQVVPIPVRAQVTKRILLSDLNKIFDPLGFLTPVLIKGKIFLQQLWQLKIGWDNPLPNEMKIRWELFYQELEELGSLPIPRKCKPYISKAIELHGFSDASQEAYGGCIFVRSKDDDGNWHSHLLCAKSRVAPLKGATIPRMELCGALVLARLAEKVAAAWSLDISHFHFWTDSMVVLGWLNCQISRLKTYVANRIEQILEFTQVEQWRHVVTKENPADVLSRGVSAAVLKNSTLWWNGPRWLTEHQCWQSPKPPSVDEETLPEIRQVKFVFANINSENQLIQAYSDWNRLIKANAWMAKFVEFLKAKRAVQQNRTLTVKDLQLSKSGLLRRAQEDAFEKEIACLSKGVDIPHKSKLRSLSPYLKDGLIRVGGRLQNSNVPCEQKHPIVLPSNNPITTLIFNDCHKRMLHCGPQLLLAELRRTFWPIRGRVTARIITKKCVICIRANPSFNEPVMAPLPRQRVQPTRPFNVSGVDFAGPLIIRSGIRGRPGKKAWIAIFVCFVTRAIHIEVVEDLTSSAFIAALRRFISRRGKPHTIWSDNGTNFVGANKELAAYVSKLDQQLASEGITWKFNPPSAPHFGGLWESAVKSAKHHLTRVVRGMTLTLSELQTLLCQIEGCLNSRPLAPMSSDPNDLEPITPAHFLIGGPMSFQPEPAFGEMEVTHLKRWKLVQCMLQGFWKRWHGEYLPQLQVRNKWVSEAKSLCIGDLVIIKEDNTPPTKWNLARVINTHPGKDGVVRVVTVRTANGTKLDRPVVKLCRLPVEKQDSVENNNFQRGENV